MPIYEYRCRECGATSEFLTGLGKDETISCQGCGSPKMEKIMSVPSFVSQPTERAPGHTCCGREERCETPPCSSGGSCRRDA
jgi:putative FmdB family regulatory protein